MSASPSPSNVLSESVEGDLEPSSVSSPELHTPSSLFPLAFFSGWDTPGSDLTSVDGCYDSISLDDVFDAEDLDDLLGSFSKATGVAAGVTYVDGSFFSSKLGFCEYCKRVRTIPEGERLCLFSDALFGAEAASSPEPVCHRCYSSGLFDGAAALRLPNGLHIGNVLVGQVAVDDDLDPQRRFLRDLGVPESDIEDLVGTIFRLSHSQFTAISNFLFQLTSALSNFGYYGLLKKAYIRQLNIRDTELRYREAQLRGTLNSIDQAVIVVSSVEGCVVRCNQAAVELFPVSILNFPLSDVVQFRSFPSLQILSDPTATVLTEQVTVRSTHDCAIYVFSTDSVLRTVDSAIREFLFSCTPLAGSGREGCVLVISEVTSQRLLQAKVAEHSKFELLGRFSTFISHNANQYLQGITGCTEALLLDKPGKDEADLLSTIMSSSSDCSNLIDRMLSITSVNQSVLVFEDVNVCKLLLNVQSIVSSFNSNIHITVSCCEADCFIKADASQIQSAFLNLCVNAIEAIQKAYSSGTVSIVARRCTLTDSDFHGFAITPGEFVRIRFCDDGVGISEERLPKVFDPFWSSKLIRSGTGVGLASVRSIVSQHSGAVLLESQSRTETARGSTEVVVYLPIITPDLTSNSCSQKQLAVETSDLDGVVPRNVVLIDDSEIVLHAVSALLGRLNCEVSSFSDPLEAIEYLADVEFAPDLIVLDVLMSVKGLDVLAKIRELNMCTPVVFSSGYRQEEFQIRDLEEKGVVGFLKKPFTSTDLIQILNML